MEKKYWETCIKVISAKEREKKWTDGQKDNKEIDTGQKQRQGSKKRQTQAHEKEAFSQTDGWGS